jgi:hypothetical protein
MVGLQICKRPLRSCCFRNQRRRDRNRHSNSGCGDAVPARADTPRDCTDEIFFEKNLRAEISQNARARRFYKPLRAKYGQVLPALADRIAAGVVMTQARAPSACRNGPSSERRGRFRQLP